MSQVDIRRFVDNISELFAPTIDDGQVFFAFLDEEENFYSVRGNNLLSGNVQKDIERISTRAATLATQINNIQNDCSDLPTIRNQIQSLQSDVNTLQSTSGGSSSENSASIITVDEIVYGAYDSNPSPDNKKVFRGRGYIHSSGYGEIVYASFSIQSTADKVYAGFADGKIHTNVEYGEVISSTPIDNGTLIFCKADNALYQYDAENHKFIQLGGKRHYVVDRIVDAVTSVEVNNPLPSEVNSVGKVFANLKYSVNICYVNSSSGNYSYNVYEFEPEVGFCFANIQSILSDDAAIYKVFANYNDDKDVIAIHDLQDGDSIYCKADGSTYLFTNNGTAKSFVKIHSPAIAPVLDIVQIGTNKKQYPSAGDKYIEYDSYLGAWILYTSPTGGTWDNEISMQNGVRYVSSTDFKIYEFWKNEEWESAIAFPVDIPVGYPFFNKADKSLYVYDGTDIIKMGGNQ